MSEVVTITSKKKKAPFIIGLIVLIFAITGVVSIVDFAVSKLSTGEEEAVDYSEYADFLTWVVGVDPAPFSDVTNADKDALRNIAICTLLSDDVKTGDYEVTEKGLIVPAADVEKYYFDMFGPDVGIVHASVVGYGYEFTYNGSNGTYTVPLTGVTPPFSVRIESVQKTGGLAVLRVGYVGTNNVEVLPDGTLAATQPDKYADITIRETENGFNLISVMTVTVGEFNS